jgi:hypothetical protein
MVKLKQKKVLPCGCFHYVYDTGREEILFCHHHKEDINGKFSDKSLKEMQELDASTDIGERLANEILGEDG